MLQAAEKLWFGWLKTLTLPEKFSALEF